jgi:hypothetical protein
LDLPYRDARYLLEKFWLPRGAARTPGRGNHRRLNAGQAVRLGLVLKLKVCGLKSPHAARIAAAAERIKGLTKNRVWDWQFSPFDGALNTEHRWYLEVGDGKYVRWVTDAHPDVVGLYEFPWSNMRQRQPSPSAAPVVCVRVDISALARLLQGLAP